MKRIVILMCGLLALLLTACGAGGESGGTEDRFCGFYLVRDASDTDGLDGVTGNFDPETKTVRFDVVEGYSCFMGAERMEDGNPDVLRTFCGDGVELSEGVLGKDSRVTFTWHVSEGQEQVVRPLSVYQRGNGEFYLKSEMSAFGGGITGVSDSKVWKENGEERRLDCKLDIVYEKPLESVSFKEFDGEDRRTAHTVLVRDAWKDTLPLGKDTVWMLAEANYADGSVIRTVYSRGEEQDVAFWFLGEDGIGREKKICFSA